MSKKKISWVVEEIKTKHCVVEEKIWREVLAQVWDLLVEENCQFKNKLLILPKEPNPEVKDSKKRSAL